MKNLMIPSLIAIRVGKSVALALFASCFAAQAHVVLDNPSAVAGSDYKATFKVAHGCGVSAMRQLVVSVPVGVQKAKPMPKAGWIIEITREKLTQPYNDHGRQVTDDVARVSWTAKTPADTLPNARAGEFTLHARLPATAGKIYWPVSQVCVEGQNDWVQVPQAGQIATELKSPAPALEITTSDAAKSQGKTSSQPTATPHHSTSYTSR